MVSTDESTLSGIGWDSAIQDADAELAELRRRQARLRQAILIFKAKKRDGVPWPAEKPDESSGE